MTIAKNVEVPEITTAVLTSTYIELLIDPKLFQWKNKARNRRLAYIIVFIVGIISGSYMHAKLGTANTLTLAACVKAIVTISFFFNSKAHAKSSST
ncbi:unnamed protein product [Adineta ricciae]|uniref:Uncharacterized protein n=1 Tax=Adineta ricciae TaxID=249248 RepID=A0A815MMF1_ADIRI|nr:unnamed protein product [Adineta ricciae]